MCEVSWDHAIPHQMACCFFVVLVLIVLEPSDEDTLTELQRWLRSIDEVISLSTSTFASLRQSTTSRLQSQKQLLQSGQLGKRLFRWCSVLDVQNLLSVRHCLINLKLALRDSKPIKGVSRALEPYNVTLERCPMYASPGVVARLLRV